MKMALKLFTAIMLVCASMEVGSAQQVANPNSYNYYYIHNITAARSYAQNTIDTLPNAAINTWYTQTQAAKTLSATASQYLVFVLEVQDSLFADIYFDEYDPFTGTYTQVYADSIIETAKKTVRIPLVTTTVNRLSGNFLPVRGRLSIRNVTQGILDATDSPIYRPRWIWKP